jgi:hypothetical protein
MDTSKASIKFLKLSPSNKITTGGIIIAALTENAAYFPALPFSVTALQAANDGLQEAIVAAKTGDKTAIRTLKKVQADWNSKYKETSAYITFVSKGSAEIISKGGFIPTDTTRKKRQRSGMLQGYKVTAGEGKGTCTASCTAAQESDGYVSVAAPMGVKATMSGDTLVLTTVNGEVIQIKAGSKREISFDSLTSSLPVCVSMYTFNSAGSSPLSSGVATPQ